MIRHLAAVAATTTLLVTAMATQATATPTGTAETAGTAGRVGCVKHVLKEPAGSVPGSSAARTADPSGRYVLGEASRDGRMHPHAVLWVNGAPRWLTSQAEGESFAYSVIEGGYVLGSTSSLAGEDHWIYSARTNSYRTLEPPANFRISALAGMNENQDIIGTTWDEALGEHVPFVWPAGGQPQLLPVPAGQTLRALDDISDEGLIIGRLHLPDGQTTSYLWKSWNAEPVRLPGVNAETVWARDIEGTSIAGEEGSVENITGLIWNAEGAVTKQLEKGVIDINTAGDAATAGLWGPLGEYPSMIIKSDGRKIMFPGGTQLQHMFERGARWTAAGYDVSSGTLVPTVYACR